MVLGYGNFIDMKPEQAADILRSMYDDGRKSGGKAVLAIHMFGIIYAKEISSLNVKDILAIARMPASYATEISKGRALAEYVTVVKDFP